MLALLNSLHESCGETVVLAEQSGLYLRYVSVLRNKERPLCTDTRPGLLRPLCTSATGLALLSQQRDAEIGRIVRDVNSKALCTSTPIHLKDVKARIAEARRYGFVVSRHNLAEGIGVVAMPFTYPSRGRRFAVGIGAPTARLDRRQSTLVMELRECVSAWNKVVVGVDE
jgi:DNA-binding IclR family transcriptional regulator